MSFSTLIGGSSKVFKYIIHKKKNVYQMKPKTLSP